MGADLLLLVTMKPHKGSLQAESLDTLMPGWGREVKVSKERVQGDFEILSLLDAPFLENITEVVRKWAEV